MGREMLRPRDRAYPRLRTTAQLAVRRGQEVRPLEPPVPEQLGVERRHDDAVSVSRLLPAEALEQMHEVGGVPPRPLVRDRRLVRAFPAQVYVRAADAPQL